MNSIQRIVGAVGLVGLLAGAGCKKTSDNTLNYRSAIDTYYSSRPSCLWSDEVKFPVQADTSDVSKTTGYDALVDQGLLQRTTAEKKRFILGSKQVTNYDLTDKGRSAWTADQSQPGFGNFCYGTRKVSSIDSATPSNSQPGATTTVNYHYTLSGTPGWATAAETQTAFPQVKNDVTGPLTAVASLTNTTNGWAVSGAPKPASGADGTIVQ
ncbi:hypothetical protein FTO74_00420 [Granulicella sp. WH15]|uniref:hypothetical protein n=1 Tax=Granulicella sp. WH15 TaxID=2602070 RepID=UPI001366D22A|nr:hypothetical protein [Granulicella sp. WH15]QHN02012.1 hypothetical protein FTO74_00420 [Granulicella sp. WH15]